MSSLNFSMIDKQHSCKGNVLNDPSHPLMKGICKYYNIQHPEIIEQFFGGGSKKKTKVTNEDETDISSFDKQVNENISKDFKKNMSEILQKNSQDISQKNSTQIKAFLAMNNSAVFQDFKIKGTFTLDLDQANVGEQEVTASNEEFSMTNLNSTVSNTTNQQFEDIITDGERLGELTAGVINNAVDTAGDVANNYINTAGDVISGGVDAAAGVANNAIGTLGDTAAGVLSIGGSKSNTESNTKRKYKESKTNIDINKSLTESGIDIKSAINTALDKSINNESINDCAASTQLANEAKVAGVEADDADIKVSQENLFSQILNCQFKKETMNTVVDDMINDLASQASDKNLSPGTIEGIGIGIAAAAEGVGKGVSTAAEGVGEGVSTAAIGAGEGLSKAASGVGDALSGVFDVLGGPFIGIFLVIAAFAAIYYFVFMKNKA